MLFLAAMAGNEAMVEALVSLKANLEAADKIKFTPLMAAAASGTRSTRVIVLHTSSSYTYKI